MASLFGLGPVPRPVKSMLRPLAISASGMSAQQRSLETISANIANAETTRTAEGGPYKRRVAVMEQDGKNGVRVQKVVEDTSKGSLIYEPGHPDADANGFVLKPNVDIASEIVDLMIARRVHEANATVFQAAKAMLRRALDI
ncbi:MAG: flagellar basal body rod protein FlgC [Gemmatimonadota bacterium]